MPRLPPSYFRKATAVSHDVAALLPACRDISSSIRELRWIREHVASNPDAVYSPSATAPFYRTADALYRRWHVSKLCRLRGSGVPLQYVLGTQPFGPLTITCRKGVLIPRPEPESYTYYLAYLVSTNQIPSLLPSTFSHSHTTKRPWASQLQSLRILDLCTGTGCIALLLHHLLSTHFPNLHIHTRGVDISARAVALARKNARDNQNHPAPDSQTTEFRQADLFGPNWDGGLTNNPMDGKSDIGAHQGWDIITCNPPYISTSGFATDTARAVRNHEPKLAQVPDAHLKLPPATHEPQSVAAAGYGDVRREDIFYARLLQLAASMPRRPRVVLCEVGGMEQAERVVGMLVRSRQWLRPQEGQGLHEERQNWTENEIGADIVESVEIWRDSPEIPPEGARDGGEEMIVVEGTRVIVRGSGHGRSVFIRYK